MRGGVFPRGEVLDRRTNSRHPSRLPLQVRLRQEASVRFFSNDRGYAAGWRLLILRGLGGRSRVAVEISFNQSFAPYTAVVFSRLSFAYEVFCFTVVVRRVIMASYRGPLLPALMGCR